MRKGFVTLLLAALLSAGAWPVQAGDAGLVGNWKITIHEEGQALTFWILKVENNKGISGQVIPLRRVPPSALTDFRLTDDILEFKITLNNQVLFTFEAKLPPAGAKRMFGSLSRGSKMIPAVLESTTASNQHELDRELLLRSPTDPGVFQATLDLLGSAKAEKATSKEVEEWVATALRNGALYGPRWSGETSLKLLETLVPDWNEPAVALSSKLLAGLGPKAAADTQLRLLEIQAAALTGLGRAEAARAAHAKIDNLESLAYAAHLKSAQAFPLDRFPGRKSSSQRGVLVELFTGAQCPPCVAADLAFDAVERTYQHKDVVLLQYHLHVPGPDPLTNPGCETRQEYYGSAVRGTPAILFNGKAEAPGGGGADDAHEKYKEYRGVIDPLLEKTTPIKLLAQAARKGDKVVVRAIVEGVPDPGDKIRLRVALVEDWVRYKARNGMAYHHRVVRAFAGGPEGIALTKKNADQTLTVDLAEVLKKTNKYLDDFASNEGPFPDGQRPLRLRNLRAVVFVQSDESREVLNAVDTAVVEQQ